MHLCDSVDSIEDKKNPTLFPYVTNEGILISENVGMGKYIVQKYATFQIFPEFSSHYK